MIVFYADGSKEKGFGHLYRLYKIYLNFFKELNVIFIYLNKTQKIFYEQNNLKHISHQEFIANDVYIDLLIVDSKEHDIDFISDIINKSAKKIAVDVSKKWVSNFDYIIFPSFYFDPSYIEQHNISSKILYGEKFCIPPQISEEEHEFKKILITFGGSDPNDLSLLVLEKLNSLGLIEDSRLIVGPGFQKGKSFFKNKYNKLNVVGPVKETASYIKNSEIVFTALGTTVQEIEFLNKFGAIFFNYEADKDDFDMIRLKSHDKNRWHSFGLYNEPILDKVIKMLEIYGKIDKSKKPARKWGYGWNNFLKHLNI